MENIIGLIMVGGKRFTGKDFICKFSEKFLSGKLKINVQFIHATDELKKDFAEFANLNYEKLIQDRQYKEKHRENMTNFANEQISKFGNCYYNMLLKKNVLDKTNVPTLYIIDFRYLFELDYYLSLNLYLISIKIEVNKLIKKERGWIFNETIDTNNSEIDIDKFDKWDLIFNNDVDGLSFIEKFLLDKLVPKLEFLINDK